MEGILNYLFHFLFIQKQVKGPSYTQREKWCEYHEVGKSRGHIRVCFGNLTFALAMSHVPPAFKNTFTSS